MRNSKNGISATILLFIGACIVGIFCSSVQNLFKVHSVRVSLDKIENIVLSQSGPCKLQFGSLRKANKQARALLLTPNS